MEEKDLEFKRDLRTAIERLLIGSFYTYGIWNSSDEGHEAAKELIVTKKYADDYCALSVIDRYFEDVIKDVEHQYFNVNHIASHHYWSYYTQTERIMVKRFVKNTGKSVEEAQKIVKEAEYLDYKIDTTKFPQSISDNFSDATEQEKPLIDEIYSITLREIIDSYMGRNKSAESDVKKHLSWLVDVKLSRNNYPTPKAFIEKYLDRIYDIAYEKLTERYTLLPSSEE